MVSPMMQTNRDDLFSVTSLKRYPCVAGSDFHKATHVHSWKTLVRAEKNSGRVADRRLRAAGLRAGRRGAGGAHAPDGTPAHAAARRERTLTTRGRLSAAGEAPL